ncbi:MAG: hypothetical protein E3K37_01300 [Candidatus Kuenenia sp.]|nr:hypothetical protein [Candidatus Kuenenia hertensis]
MTLSDDLTGDLDTFLDTDDFGTAITYGGNTIYGIFDSAYESADGVESSGPQVVVKSSDVPVIAHGAAMVIAGTTYYVINAQPDGTGISVILLSKDAP